MTDDHILSTNWLHILRLTSFQCPVIIQTQKHNFKTPVSSGIINFKSDVHRTIIAGCIHLNLTLADARKSAFHVMWYKIAYIMSWREVATRREPVFFSANREASLSSYFHDNIAGNDGDETKPREIFFLHAHFVCLPFFLSPLCATTSKII